MPNELASLLISMPATVRLLPARPGHRRRDRHGRQDAGACTCCGSTTSPRSTCRIWSRSKPPSETDQLAFNYIDWLANAGEHAARSSASSSPAAKPAALLYLMLRNALLLQLHHGAYEWLEERGDFEPALEQSLVTTALRRRARDRPPRSRNSS